MIINKETMSFLFLLLFVSELVLRLALAQNGYTTLESIIDNYSDELVALADAFDQSQTEDKTRGVYDVETTLIKVEVAGPASMYMNSSKVLLTVKANYKDKKMENRAKIVLSLLNGNKELSRKIELLSKSETDALYHRLPLPVGSVIGNYQDAAFQSEDKTRGVYVTGTAVRELGPAPRDKILPVKAMDKENRVKIVLSLLKKKEELSRKIKKLRKASKRHELESCVGYIWVAINHKDMLADKINFEDKEKMENILKETTKWLNDNFNATTNDIEEKRKEVEAVCNPIIKQLNDVFYRFRIQACQLGTDK